MAIEIRLERGGAERNQLTRHAVALTDALAGLDASPGGGFLRVAHERAILREIQAYVRKRPARVTDVVQLGIGGSSLGAQALCAALLHPRHNERARKGELRFHFPENVDPESFGALLEGLNPSSTLVHVVSKSGGTLETAAQLYALLEAFRSSGRRFSMQRNLVATTGAKGALRDLVDAEEIPSLSFPEDVAGRYSVFTASGLLVPALCGVPVGRVLKGARAMEERCRDGAMGGPAGRLAALHHYHDVERNRPIHVELIYSDALYLCGSWFRQIWAESLGKQGRGPTPVIARGTTDQHSQIQLYTEGPDDKLYTLIRVTRPRRNVRIARGAKPEVLSGRSMAALFDAEAEGTAEALVSEGRPLIDIRLPRVTPDAVGELMMLQQLQTALAGALYRVDPFTQPGVEAGKLAAVRLLTGGSPAG
ncbi:MAG: glucose-6-phosphate isomerase [Deltaproteobacteria bacterium]|nr:glucose-6-phosphate isomerase [Deltaproteobacteria bacterium]